MRNEKRRLRFNILEYLVVIIEPSIIIVFIQFNDYIVLKFLRKISRLALIGNEDYQKQSNKQPCQEQDKVCLNLS